MLLGSQQDNMKFVVDLLASVGFFDENHPQKTQQKNFILSPGCDMPYDTPPENVAGVLQAVRDPAGTRRMLASYEAHGFDLPDDAGRACPKPREAASISPRSGRFIALILIVDVCGAAAVTANSPALL